MTIIAEYRKDDEGVPFGVILYDENYDTIANISSATTKDFIFRKPSGTLTTVSGIFVTDGSDGKLYYTFATNDLSEVGTYAAQCRLIMGTKKLRSSIVNFRVFDNL